MGGPHSSSCAELGQKQVGELGREGSVTNRTNLSSCANNVNFGKILDQCSIMLQTLNKVFFKVV